VRYVASDLKQPEFGDDNQYTSLTFGCSLPVPEEERNRVGWMTGMMMAVRSADVDEVFIFRLHGRARITRCARAARAAMPLYPARAGSSIGRAADS
jgi:hypothetical protein